jgi:hypothetical protein
MDPAVDLPILPPLVERARGAFFTVRVNPVIDTVEPEQVFHPKAFGRLISAVGKTDEDMGEDVPAATCNPWHKVFNDPFLVPSPLLAALPALVAVLGHTHDISREE